MPIKLYIILPKIVRQTLTLHIDTLSMLFLVLLLGEKFNSFSSKLFDVVKHGDPLKKRQHALRFESCFYFFKWLSKLC